MAAPQSEGDAAFLTGTMRPLGRPLPAHCRPYMAVTYFASANVRMREAPTTYAKVVRTLSTGELVS